MAFDVLHLLEHPNVVGCTRSAWRVNLPQGSFHCSCSGRGISDPAAEMCIMGIWGFASGWRAVGSTANVGLDEEWPLRSLQELDALLAQPLQAGFSRKFFTGVPSASLETGGRPGGSALAAAPGAGVARSVHLAQTVADSRRPTQVQGWALLWLLGVRA